jgi:hypothetical protein
MCAAMRYLRAYNNGGAHIPVHLGFGLAIQRMMPGTNVRGLLTHDGASGDMAGGEAAVAAAPSDTQGTLPYVMHVERKLPMYVP